MGHLNLGNIMFMFHHIHVTFKFREFGAAASNRQVSFMSNNILQTLDRKLKEIGNRTRAFGGFSIIFSGDFHQLKPVGSNEKELMFSRLSNGHWDYSINVVIILNNEHCFKEDPEYGQMLTRL
jgi:hypothetical protein